MGIYCIELTELEKGIETLLKRLNKTEAVHYQENKTYQQFFYLSFWMVFFLVYTLKTMNIAFINNQRDQEK